MNINIREDYGWSKYTNKQINLWFKGYLTNIGKDNPSKVIFNSVDCLVNKQISIDSFSEWVAGLSGHFSFVIECVDDWCFIATDRICSIPIFESSCNEDYSVSNYAPYLSDKFGDNLDINLNSALEISMSGFSIGNRTLYNGINRLSAGECVLLINNNIYRKYYYTYTPYKENFYNYSKLKKNFTNVLLSTLRETIDSAKGRQIVVPLSAGNDSRLIASGLKNLKYNNVICFSYGRSGNYEVETSKKVCNILGYKWVYVQDRVLEKRSFFKSDVYKEYVNAFESYASVPNVQDVYEVYMLKKMSVINNDAIFINGNSGDFISGGHIPKNLDLNSKISSDNSYSWIYFLDKHYSLWRKLCTKFNYNIVTSSLFRQASYRCITKKNKSAAYSVIECMECIGRQSRLVANQQRAYEFIDHEWRLPLWSKEMLDFWETVPAKFKINQKLYKDVLYENNWGGVWHEIDINNKLIRPYTLWIIRSFVKLLIAPFGKRRWHRIEKKLFVYWMHPTYARAVTSFFNVLLDNRGQRNTNSWTADQFIRENGFDKGVLSLSDEVCRKFKR